MVFMLKLHSVYQYYLSFVQQGYEGLFIYLKIILYTMFDMDQKFWNTVICESDI